ncbi:unnamed protein product [Alopecurus aequalis]
MPATPMDGVPAAMPTTSSTSDNKQQLKSKRKLHMFQEIVAGEYFTEAQATTGIILAGKTKKYWVDKNGNNCFMLFPRDMSIAWAENPDYWSWQPMEEGSDHDVGIKVAELKNVCWLEITGKQELSHLTPGVTYEVIFEAMLKRKSSGWHVPVDLRLKFPDGRVQEQKESLQERYSEEQLQLKVADVEAKKGLEGELVVSLSEHGGHWKRGLIIKGIRITPKEC